MEKSAKKRKISVFKLWVLSDFTIVGSGFSSDFTIRQKTQAKLGCRSDLKKFQTHESSGFLNFVLFSIGQLLVCCGCWFIALCIHFAFELLSTSRLSLPLICTRVDDRGKGITMVKQAFSVSFSSPPCLLRVAHLAFSPSHSLPELQSMVRCMSLCNPPSALYLSLLKYLLLDSMCCRRSTVCACD